MPASLSTSSALLANAHPVIPPLVASLTTALVVAFAFTCVIICAHLFQIRFRLYIYSLFSILGSTELSPLHSVWDWADLGLL